MADFSLATTRTDQVPTADPLSAPTISLEAGSLQGVQVPQINPGAASVGHASAPVPQAQDNMFLKGFTQFMDSTARAAMRFQERESEYYAREAAMNYESKMLDLFNGYEDADGNFVPGYKSTKLQGALDGYEVYNEQLDTVFDEVLKDLEPRVRQKAVFKMADSRSSLKNKAAAHRLAEFEKAEDDREFKELRVLTKRAETHPEKLFTPDAEGLTIVDRMKSKFDTEEAFFKWFGPEIKTMVSSKYTDEFNGILRELRQPGLSEIEKGDIRARAAVEAYEQARNFAVMVAEPLLELDPQSENAIFRMLETYQNQALSAEADRSRIKADAVDAAADAEEQAQRDWVRSMRLDVLQGKREKPSEDEFRQHTNLLPHSEWQAHYNGVYNPQREEGDPLAEHGIIQMARNGQLTPEAQRLAQTNPNISAKALDRAKQLQIDAEDEKTGADTKQTLEYVENMFIQDALQLMLSKFDAPGKKAYADLYVEAQDMARSCIKSGESIENCKTRVGLKYDQNADSETSLPSVVIDTIEHRPASATAIIDLGNQLKKQQKWIQAQFEAIPEGEQPSVQLLTDQAYYEENLKVWQRWRAWNQRNFDFYNNLAPGG